MLSTSTARMEYGCHPVGGVERATGIEPACLAWELAVEASHPGVRPVQAAGSGTTVRPSIRAKSAGFAVCTGSPRLRAIAAIMAS